MNKIVKNGFFYLFILIFSTQPAIQAINFTSLKNYCTQQVDALRPHITFENCFPWVIISCVVGYFAHSLRNVKSKNASLQRHNNLNTSFGEKEAAFDEGAPQELNVYETVEGLGLDKNDPFFVQMSRRNELEGIIDFTNQSIENKEPVPVKLLEDFSNIFSDEVIEQYNNLVKIYNEKLSLYKEIEDSVSYEVKNELNKEQTIVFEYRSAMHDLIGNGAYLLMQFDSHFRKNF